MKPYAAIENKLREYRIQLQLSQTQLAVYSQVAPSTIYRVERCGYYPNAQSRQAIVTYLAKSIEGITEEEIWGPHDQSHMASTDVPPVSVETSGPSTGDNP